MAKRFYPLRIRSVRKDTSDAITICLDVPEDLQQEFSFEAGQHLTIKALVDGEEVRRNYSLCSAPHENKHCFTVKQVPEGRFSTYANEMLHEGMSVSVMPPDGSFVFPFKASNTNTYVAFAAGSGITPTISILKSALTIEPHSKFILFFANKSKDQIIFLEELAGLKNRFMDRLAIYHFLSRREQEFEIFNGRIDQKKCRELAQFLFAPGEVEAYFLCGPHSMMEEVSKCLIEMGVARKRIKRELFTSPEMLDRKDTLAAVLSEETHLVGHVEVRIDGHTHRIAFEHPKSILDVALDHGLELPFACKGGVCCTCKAQLIEGKVDMLVNYGLDEEELEKDFILTCQAVPKSDKVVVDYDVI